MVQKTVLVTGGSGYIGRSFSRVLHFLKKNGYSYIFGIGSHTVIELLNAGREVVIYDNLSNSSYEAIRRIEKITGKKPTFYKADVLDKKALLEVFSRHPIDSVIHFAGLKAVGESTEIPLDYYYNNVTGTIVLLQAMKEANIKNIVFSSSATVYGEPPVIPIPETSPMVSVYLCNFVCVTD